MRESVLSLKDTALVFLPSNYHKY